MDSEYILRMRFNTAQGRLHSITLNEAKIDADENAEPVMDQIITDNIFTTPTGDLASKHSVVLTIRDFVELNISG